MDEIILNRKKNAKECRRIIDIIELSSDISF
jgi:hypothetical protein